jgi:Dolichyl-phosphate-mannose-protein mannosyltransferase
MKRRSAAVAAVASVFLAGIVLDLGGRAVARRSLIRDIAGASADPWTLLALAVAAAIILGILLPRRRVLLLFAVLFAAGAAMQLQLAARLQSDGFYYFAYLRSMAFDGDLDFSNDYRLLGLGDKAHLFEPTPTGYAQSAWSIGPAIVWSPFFTAGHVVAVRLSARNPDVSADGISFPYRQAVCIAGLFYGLLGCWFCYRLTRRLYPPGLAAAATAMVATGSFMLWYIVKEPSMTHAPSMAVVAGFTWAWLATRDGRTTRQWALLGALAGFMTLIRWQNTLFAILPLCDAGVALIGAWRRRDRPAFTATVRNGLLFTLSSTLAFLPQMIAWRSIYGTWLAVSPVGPQIRWSDPHIVDILWSSRNGLFATSPALYCAAIGLVAFAFRRPATGLPMVLSAAVMVYFNSIIQDWWGSDGYGMRRFDGLIPFFTVGLAAFAGGMTRMVQRWPAVAPALAGAALVGWNLTLMQTAATGFLRIGETVSLGAVASHQAAAAVRWVGHPFSWPVNLLYSWRNDVGPSAYDLLAVNAFLGDPARPYGRVDVGLDDQIFLADGWHAPERDGATTFRWVSQRAELRIPLDHRADLRVELRLRAFVVPSRPQHLRLEINGNPAGEWTLEGDWQTIEFAAPQALWRSGVNRVVLYFAAATRPVDAGMSGDTRPLAAAVDYLRVQKSGG